MTKSMSTVTLVRASFPGCRRMRFAMSTIQPMHTSSSGTT